MKDQENLRRLRREWYHRNKERESAKQIERNKIRREEVTTYIANLKESTPCADCGKYYPACVMDFDHLRDKQFSIGRMASNRTLPIILKEIEKCEIVCANCHRLRTQQRRMEVV